MMRLGALARHEEGQDLIEYALLASLVSIVSVLGLWMLGSVTKNFFSLLYLIWPNGA